MATEQLVIEILGKDKTKAAFNAVNVGLKGLGVAAGAAVAGVVGLTAAAFNLAQQATPMEGITAAFTGLAEAAGVGSAEMIARLQEASGGMVSQRDLMLSFNKAAQLVSQEFAVNLPNAMGALQKVSAATGQDMGFLMDSLVVGVGRMSPMILDNLGIQVSLAEATALSTEMFGKQADQLTQSEKQAGLMALVTQKLNDNTADMPDVTSTATASFNRFTAQLADLKDEIGLALLPAFGSLANDMIPLLKNEILPLLRDMLPSFVAFIKELTMVLGKVATDIMTTIGPAIDIINEAFQRAGFETDTLTVTMETLEWILGSIATAIKVASIAIAGWILFAGDVRDVWNGVIDTLRDVDRAIAQTMDKVADLTSNAFNMLPSFHGGGIVPGKPGSEMLAMLQAGERVIPASQVSNTTNNNFNATFNSPMPSAGLQQDFRLMQSLARVR